MANPQKSHKDEAPALPTPRRNAVAGFARLYWVLAGPAIAGFLLVAITQHGHALSWRDLAYGSAVVSLIVVRYIDVARLSGTTADGDPATLRHWRVYATLLLVICAAVWLVAHGMAFLLAR